MSPALPKPTTSLKLCLLVTTLFIILAAYSYWKDWKTTAIVASIVGLLVASVALFFPKLLSLLNQLWGNFWWWIGKSFGLILLGIIFFSLITPISLLTRLLGRDELRLKKRIVASYWIDRLPQSSAADSFKNQY
jgi:hypothetical protein